MERESDDREDSRTVHRVRRSDGAGNPPILDDKERPAEGRGDRGLALGVFAQAIDDLRKPKHRKAALSFLTSEEPEWQDSRELWANLAGIDPDAMRDKILSDEEGVTARVKAVNHRREVQTN
jgi:hypothetical protein